MLADVLKQKEIERRKNVLLDFDKWNKPVDRKMIIYYDSFHIIGGIETWIYNLATMYEFTVMYRRAYDNQIKRLEDIGCECIKYVGQPVKCDTLIFTLVGHLPNIEARNRKLFIHGEYRTMEEIGTIPKHDEIYAVSEYVGQLFEKVTGIKCKTMYNPVVVNKEEIKPIIIGVFSRLSAEKGKERTKILIDKLVEKNKPFLIIIFTDLPFEYDDKRVIFIDPTLNIHGWMSICTYICQLSDREAASLTLQEGLKLGKPVIVTELPILKEFGINETNAKILDFNMTNLDVDDLWNIPKVNWKEPVSKEWEEIMKKKVFRAIYGFKSIEEEPKVTKTEETPKPKTTKKKKSDK